MGTAVGPERTEPSDGAGDASRGGVCACGALATEKRVDLCEKNDPMLHPLAGLSAGAGCALLALKLRGRTPLAGAGGGCGDDSGVESTESLADRMLPASDFVTSTTLLEALPACGPELSGALVLRCIHRPRTLSTALKKPVEASVKVLEMASPVGASR